MPGESPGNFRCPLGKAHFIARQGYDRGSEGPGSLVPEWLEFDIIYLMQLDASL